MAAQVLTANRLRDGLVIYLGTDGAWTEDIAKAPPALDDEAAAALGDAGERAVAQRFAVAPYLIEVDVVDGVARPMGARERIRALRRPTIAFGVERA